MPLPQLVRTRNVFPVATDPTLFRAEGDLDNWFSETGISPVLRESFANIGDLALTPLLDAVFQKTKKDSASLRFVSPAANPGLLNILSRNFEVPGQNDPILQSQVMFIDSEHRIADTYRIANLMKVKDGKPVKGQVFGWKEGENQRPNVHMYDINAQRFIPIPDGSEARLTNPYFQDGIRTIVTASVLL